MVPCNAKAAEEGIVVVVLSCLRGPSSRQEEMSSSACLSASFYVALNTRCVGAWRHLWRQRCGDELVFFEP
eukprot:4785473-Alexandrium_andersonii.AAC.1